MRIKAERLYTAVKQRLYALLQEENIPYDEKYVNYKKHKIILENKEHEREILFLCGQLYVFNELKDEM